MNEAFIKAVQGSGMSQYQLAKKTGVPFSTINGFMNQTHDINRCAASTLCVLAWVLGKSAEQLLNCYHVLDKVQGDYRGIKYTWKKGENDRMELSFKDGDKTVCIHTRYRFDIPSQMGLYTPVTEIYIDSYLEEKEIREKLLV